MRISTRDMILVSFFAALTVIGAKISLNLPYIPASLQLIFCCFAGIILGARLGMLSQLVYLVIGLIGVPVFAKPIAGPEYILQPSFGYILGFVVAAYVVGFLRERYHRVFIAVLSGIVIDYIIAIPYMYFIVNMYMGKSMTFNRVLAVGFTPFIIKDLVGGIAVSLVAAAVIPALKSAGLIKDRI